MTISARCISSSSNKCCRQEEDHGNLHLGKGYGREGSPARSLSAKQRCCTAGHCLSQNRPMHEILYCKSCGWSDAYSAMVLSTGHSIYLYYGRGLSSSRRDIQADSRRGEGLGGRHPHQVLLFDPLNVAGAYNVARHQHETTQGTYPELRAAWEGYTSAPQDKQNDANYLSKFRMPQNNLVKLMCACKLTANWILLTQMTGKSINISALRIT